MAELEIKDFSGGMTDLVIDGRPNTFATYENLLIDEYGKPYQRPGSRALLSGKDELMTRVPNGSIVTWIGKIKDTFFPDPDRYYYLAYAAGRLYCSRVAEIAETASATWTEVSAPYGTHAFCEDTSPYIRLRGYKHGDFIYVSKYNAANFVGDFYVQKIWTNASHQLKYATCGLPSPNDFSGVDSTTSGTGTLFNYYVVYSSSVKTGSGATYLDVSAPWALQLKAVSSTPTTAGPLTQLWFSGGELHSDSSKDYQFDLSNIKLKVYRSSPGHPTPKLVKSFNYLSLALGGSYWTDNVKDDGNSYEDPTDIFYGYGGAVDNGFPPKCRYFCAANGIGFYGRPSDMPHRVYHSVPEDPDSVPDDYYIDFDGEITGLGVAEVYPIVFTESSTYRLEGSVDYLGAGVIDKRYASKTVGCIGAGSIVESDKAVFFAGSDGFYVTDGMNVQLLSRHLLKRYKAMTSTVRQRGQLYGHYDPVGKKVYWAGMETSSSLDNDVIWVLDLRYPLSEESSFTLMRGKNYSQFGTISLNSMRGKLIRGDRNGYFHLHDEALSTDHEPNTSIATTSWNVVPVIYKLESVALAFGNSSVKKWFSKIVGIFKNVTDISVLFSFARNTSGSYRSSKPVRKRDVVDGVISCQRRVPNGGLRGYYHQFKLSNATVATASSDELGTATTGTSGGNGTVLLASGSWPVSTEVIGLYIYFETDGYKVGHLITARSNTTLTVTKGTGWTDQAGKKWVIRGVPRDERIKIESLKIYYEPFSSSMQGYKASESGEVK